MSNKTITTQRIENMISGHFSKTGNFIAYEVQFGFHPQQAEYADCAIYNTDKILTCFEIKVSKSDFRSKAKKTFVGHKNYYAMPLELYKEVKDEIPEEIGVYAYSPKQYLPKYDYLPCSFECVKKGKKVKCELDENTILWSFIRSRCNSTSKDVASRTKVSNKLLNTIHNHLEVIDDNDKKVDLNKLNRNRSRFKKDEYFVSLLVSSDSNNGNDFYTIFDFIVNYVRESDYD